MLDLDAVRAFAYRPWGEVEDAKRAYVAERYRNDPEAHVEAVWALCEHVRATLPVGVADRERAADFEAHVAMRRSLDRAAEALRTSAR